jgi:hypothetical protein
MLRAIYSSLLASPVTSRTNSQPEHGCTWYSKEGSPPAYRVMLFTSERNKPCPLQAQAFLHKPPRICQDSRARPGCRKRKCRCGCVSPCGLRKLLFCLAQDAKFGDHFSEMFLHVPHTHRRKGWLASIAICGHLTRSESRYRIWVSLVRVVP